MKPSWPRKEMVLEGDSSCIIRSGIMVGKGVLMLADVPWVMRQPEGRRSPHCEAGLEGLGEGIVVDVVKRCGRRGLMGRRALRDVLTFHIGCE